MQYYTDFYISNFSFFLAHPHILIVFILGVKSKLLFCQIEFFNRTKLKIIC